MREYVATYVSCSQTCYYKIQAACDFYKSVESRNTWPNTCRIESDAGLASSSWEKFGPRAENRPAKARLLFESFGTISIETRVRWPVHGPGRSVGEIKADTCSKVQPPNEREF